MTLSNPYLQTTREAHNAQKKVQTATDNAFFFIQAVYGQININKRMILWNICYPRLKCSSPPQHYLMYGSLPPPGKSNPSFILFCSPLKPLYFSLYYVSYTPNVYKLSYVSGFISFRCSFFGLKDLKKKLVLSKNYNRSKTSCSYHSIGLTSYSTSSWLCALKWL